MQPVQRGQVYRLTSSDPNIHNRPVVIVSRDELNGGHSVLLVPFYSQQLEKRTKLKHCVHFAAGEAGLDKECVAKADEVTCLEKTEINLKAGPIGSVKAQKMEKIVEAIRYSVRDHTLAP